MGYTLGVCRGGKGAVLRVDLRTERVRGLVFPGQRGMMGPVHVREIVRMTVMLQGSGSASRTSLVSRRGSGCPARRTSPRSWSSTASQARKRLELLALARKTGQTGLWQREGSFESKFATLKILESRATALVSFEPSMIPGLLQTMPYAEACIREVSMVEDRAAIDERVIGRVHRQAVLRGTGAPSLVSIIGEAALRCLIGSRQVLRDQLRYLVEVAQPERDPADRSNINWRPPRPSGKLHADALRRSTKRGVA